MQNLEKDDLVRILSYFKKINKKIPLCFPVSLVNCVCMACTFYCVLLS